MSTPVTSLKKQQLTSSNTSSIDVKSSISTKINAKPAAAPPPASKGSGGGYMSAKAVPSVLAASKAPAPIQTKYFDTKLSTEVTPPVTPTGGTPRGTELRLEGSGMGRGKDGMEVPPLHPWLSSLGFTADEVNTLLRQELLKERGGEHGEGSLADWKHYYTTTGPTNFSGTTQINFPLARIAGGTAVNTRTGNTIRLRKCRVKIFIQRATQVPSAVDVTPYLQILMFRDKIPTTPGTVPTIWIAGANPPTDGSAIFDALGNTAPEARPISIRNPISESQYHIYGYHEHSLNLSEGYTFQTSPALQGYAAPKHWVFEYNIDFHDVQQKYPTYASSQPDQNDVYLCFRVHNFSANYSFLDSYTVVTDTEFRDEQI